MLVNVRNRSENRSRSFDFWPSLESEFVPLEHDWSRSLKKPTPDTSAWDPQSDFTRALTQRKYSLSS